MELTARNHPTLEAMVAFMASDQFRANPSDAEIADPAAFVAEHRRVATMA